MKLVALDLPGAHIVEIEPHVDERGFFARTWCAREFAEAGLPSELAQTNLSHTTEQWSIRGLHYQRPAEKVRSCGA